MNFQILPAYISVAIKLYHSQNSQLSKNCIKSGIPGLGRLVALAPGARF